METTLDPSVPSIDTAQSDDEVAQDNEDMVGIGAADNDQIDKWWRATSVLQAAQAHQKIKEILFLCHATGGFKNPSFNCVLLKWLCGMQ
jgi:hypothetical protein